MSGDSKTAFAAAFPTFPAPTIATFLIKNTSAKIYGGGFCYITQNKKTQFAGGELRFLFFLIIIFRQYICGFFREDLLFRRKR